VTDYSRSRDAGSVSDRGQEHRRFDDYAGTYRSDWEGRYGTNRPWAEHEEGYRYGWHAGQMERFRNRDFQASQPDLEADWDNRRTYFGEDYQPADRNQSGVERGWNDLKDAVREGFERARMEFDRRT
jgi:hypothetical protein